MLRDNRNASSFALLSCPVFTSRWYPHPVDAYEPHLEQPISWVGTPEMEYWPGARRRNLLFADGHVEFR